MSINVAKRQRIKSHVIGGKSHNLWPIENWYSDTAQKVAPAVNYDGIVASLHLNICHLINDTGDGGQIRAAAIRAPFYHM